MCNKSGSEVNLPAATVEQGSSSPADGNGVCWKPGPVEHAYDTVPFRGCELNYLHAMFCGAVQAGIQLVNLYDVELLKQYDPGVCKFVMCGRFPSGRGKPGEFVIPSLFDLEKLLYDRDGTPRDFQPEHCGKGITKSAVSLHCAVGFEVDDGPDGNPIALRDQARHLDRLIREHGLPVPNAACLAGDDRPWVLREIEQAGIRLQPGKSLHGVIAFRPTTDTAARDELSRALAVVTGGDIAVCDVAHRFRCGGQIARLDGWQDLGIWRVQTALLLHQEPATLDQVLLACEDFARTAGFDLREGWEARKVAKVLLGGVTRYQQVANAAFSKLDILCANQANAQVLELQEMAERLRRELRINPRALELRDLAVSGRVEEPFRKFAPSPISLTTRSAGSGFSHTVEDGSWPLQSRIWQLKHQGEVREGSFAALFEEFADKKVGLLQNIACPYHGQDPRGCDAEGRPTTPAGFGGWNADHSAAFFQCRSCGCKHWSTRENEESDEVSDGSRFGDGKHHKYGTKKKPGVTFPPARALQELRDELNGKALFQEFAGRYVPQLVPQRKLILVRAPWGTGKTEQVTKYAGDHPEQSILYVCPTRSLAMSAHARLKAHGFENYLDQAAGELDCSRLVTCIDSVRRIAWSRKYDVIVVDESEKVLARFNDERMQCRADVWEKLKGICRDARHAIFLDADLSVLTLHAARRLTWNGDVQFIYGTAKVGGKVRFYERMEDMEVVRKRLAGPLYLFANTLSDAETFAHLLEKEQKGTGLLVGSPTTGEPSVRELLENPNEAANAYDWICASPAVGTGVSFDTDHFPHQVAVARSGNFTTAENVCQGMYRLRNCADRHLWVDSRSAGIPEASTYWHDKLARECNREIETARALALNANFGVVRFLGQAAVDPDLIETRVEFYVAQARSQNRLRENVLRILREQGAKVVTGRKVSEGKREAMTARFKEAKEQVHGTNDQAVAEAVPIPMDMAKRIDRKPRATRREREQVRRARIAEIIGDSTPLSADTVAGFERGDLRAKILLHVGVQAFLEGQQAELAARYVEAYREDAVRAEAGLLLRAQAVARVLREVYGVGSLLEITRVPCPAPDRLTLLAGLAGDPEFSRSARLRRNACKNPIRQLGDLLRRCGLQGKALRSKVNGKARFVALAVHQGSVGTMQVLTAHQRAQLQPCRQVDWRLQVLTTATRAPVTSARSGGEGTAEAPVPPAIGGMP